MNSNVTTQWRRRVQVAAATAATMFGLCLAVTPVANAIPAPDPPPVPVIVIPPLPVLWIVLAGDEKPTP